MPPGRARTHCFRVSTRGYAGGDRVARIKTIADVVTDYKVRPEFKSNGPDEKVCSRVTAGLLRRRHVTAASEVLIGKEAHHLDDMESGTIHDEAKALSTYKDPRLDPWQTTVLPILRTLRLRDLAATAKMSERQVRRLLRGHCHPHSANRAALTRIAADHARGELTSIGRPARRDDLACCAAWQFAKAHTRAVG